MSSFDFFDFLLSIPIGIMIPFTALKTKFGDQREKRNAQSHRRPREQAHLEEDHRVDEKKNFDQSESSEEHSEDWTYSI